MVPNASVTIARYGPVTRNAGKASSAPKPAATTIPTGIAAQKPISSWNASIPAA